MNPEEKANIYSFLKTLFTTEPAEEFIMHLRKPEVLDSFKQIGITLTSDDLSKESLPILKEDYTQLFIGPQKHISMNESVYREKPARFWGEAAVQTNRLIKEIGLSLKDDWTLMPDHITVEFEILQKLAERENEALKEGDQKTVQRCQEYARNYFLNHISKWVPEACDRVFSQASTRFYKEIGSFVKHFIINYEQEISQQEEKI